MVLKGLELCARYFFRGGLVNLATHDGLLPKQLRLPAAKPQRTDVPGHFPGRFGQVSGKMIILVDDGIATGSTIRAVIAALRQQCPSKLVVAVPTALLHPVTSYER
jgi:orotate phosphoribosyltransferase-like protein